MISRRKGHKGADFVKTEENIKQILIEDIIPNRFQPRLSFDEEGLKELSESIKQHGIIQPLVLRRLGNKYEIIAGERRYKASVMAGLKTVPAIISDIDDNQSAEIALVENIQRRNLTSIEEAKSYKNLLDRGYLTQEQLAQKMGVNQSTISNKLRLLNLSPEVQDALLQEKISERHARSLLAIPKEEQSEWLKKIISKRMTVRQLDLEIKKAKGETPKEMPQINEQETNNENLLDILKEEPQEEKPKPVNKFFNFLEDEAANMNMETTQEEEPTFKVQNNEIETLSDMDIEETPIDTISPFLQTNDVDSFNNKIEEIKPNPSEEIIDPLDSVIKLSPDYENIQKEQSGLNLKNAINNVREMSESLKTKGFNLQTEELDLENTYQIIITIQK